MRTGSFLLRKWASLEASIKTVFWVCAGVSVWPGTGWAIEDHPTQSQIEAALARGKAAAAARIPPDRLYAWFGSANKLEPRGFLMTKMAGLTVMSAHFALRSETPAEADISQILEERSLLISVLIFGDRPNFAVDSYLLLAQGQRVIKPIKVRFDGHASRTSVWPNPPAYRAKVVASFSYADLDLRAKTRLSVFPAGGGEVSFDLDFAQIE
ncbi:MAG: hypothetical protein HY581_04955 [Nitrospirae bacterium]|nr:hypothetical protein [Nitrospirota bacterium]